MLRSRSLCAVVAVALLLPGAASALSIDFEGLNHGDILTPTGYDLEVVQNNAVFRAPVIFDSGTPSGSTSDQDLLFGGAWAGGNIAGRDLGNLLIIQEQGDSCDVSSCSDPDDSARGGSFRFEFDQLFASLSFALVDIDDQENEQVGSVRLILRGVGGDVVVEERTFVTFSGIDFGNRTANEFQLGVPGSFDTVEFVFASSGAIGELELNPVPEPTTSALLALGLLGLARRRRRAAA